MPLGKSLAAKGNRGATVMTPQRWQKIKRIFSHALSIERPSQRTAYIRNACAESESLRAEVEALLAQHDVDDGRLKVYTSLIGRKLSHYEVLELIGKGGIGT